MSKLRILGGAVVVLLALTLAVTVEAQPKGKRVSARGAITAIDASGVTVKAADGAIKTIPLAKLRVSRYAPIDFNNLKTNDYIGITAKRAGGKLSASMLHVFPEPMRGRGEGQRPWYGGNTMTNATVQKIRKTSMGHDVTVAFKGKSETVGVASNSVIARLTRAKAADLKVGQKVVVLGMKPQDGAAKWAILGLLP